MNAPRPADACYRFEYDSGVGAKNTHLRFEARHSLISGSALRRRLGYSRLKFSSNAPYKDVFRMLILHSL